MKSHSKYIKKETKGQIIFIVILILAIAIGLVWNALEEDARVINPDKTFKMTNAHISWEQTYHPGPWGGVKDGD